MANYYEKVFRSPMNTSISKNLYSFPKTQRFQSTPQSVCRRSFYDTNRKALGQRSTSFGYGDRVDLVNKEVIPGAGTYNSRQLPIRHNQGFSFGRTQRKQQWDGIDGVSPCKYNKTFNLEGINYSIGLKYENPLTRHQNQLGPGEYDIKPGINKTGTYFYSKYMQSKCGKIGHTVRFPSSADRTPGPGPGKYEDRLGINPTGVYFNSRIPTNFVKSFQRTARASINPPQQTPGPGTYYVFSQFANK